MSDTADFWEAIGENRRLTGPEIKAGKKILGMTDGQLGRAVPAGAVERRTLP